MFFNCYFSTMKSNIDSYTESFERSLQIDRGFKKMTAKSAYFYLRVSIYTLPTLCLLLALIKKPQFFNNVGLLPQQAEFWPLIGNGIRKANAVAVIKKQQKNRQLVTYCASGWRSYKALTILKNHGVVGLNLTGGYQAW